MDNGTNIAKPVKLSLSAYARSIGVSEGAVRKAIREGKLEFGFDQQALKIDPEEAARNSWVQKQVRNRKPGVGVEQRVERAGTGGVFTENAKQEGAGAIEDMDVAELLATLKVHDRMSIGEASKIQEILTVADKRMKLEQASGQLVARDKVERALFEIGSSIKKAFLAMPQRVVRRIMTAGTEVEGINILTEAITEILDEFGNAQLEVQ